MSASRATLLTALACLIGVLSALSCGGAPKSPDPAAASAEPAVESAPSGTARAEPQGEPGPTPTEDDTERSAGPDFSPARAAGAVVGTPAPTNTAPIVAVANYFAELPGIDLSGLDARSKEKFLHRVNSELCTCGCKDDTLARCLVNDPVCPTVKGLVLTVLDEVRTAR